MEHVSGYPCGPVEFAGAFWIFEKFVDPSHIPSTELFEF
jgi:hypothetical protein